MECLEVSEALDEPMWTLLANDIEGFRYVPGSVYTLRVEELGEDSRGSNYRWVETVDQQFDPAQRLNDIWVVRSIEGRPLSKEGLTSRPTFELNSAKRAVMGQAPCNTYNANIEVMDAHQLILGPVVSTRRACEGLEEEKMIFNALRSTVQYKIDGLNLRLLDKAGNELMLLKKVD